MAEIKPSAVRRHLREERRKDGSYPPRGSASTGATPGSTATLLNGLVPCLLRRRATVREVVEEHDRAPS